MVNFREAIDRVIEEFKIKMTHQGVNLSRVWYAEPPDKIAERHRYVILYGESK